MNENQIAFFLTVADCGSFTKTAELHFVTQPVVSKQIIALENELGFPLFLRTPKGAALTSSGKIMQKFFLESQKSYNAAICESKKMWSSENQSLHIAIMENDCTDTIDQCITELRQVFCNANIVVHKRVGSVWPSEIIEGKYDIAITHYFDIFSSPSFKTILIQRDPEYIAYHVNHPLSQVQNLNLSDFSSDTFFLPFSSDVASLIMNHFQKLCGSYGLKELPFVLLMPNIGPVHQYIKDGRGVAICRKFSNYPEEEGFKSIKLNSELKIVMVWRSENTNPLIQELNALVSSALKLQSKIPETSEVIVGD